jgi:hypothetical protein
MTRTITHIICITARQAIQNCQTSPVDFQHYLV